MSAKGRGQTLVGAGTACETPRWATDVILNRIGNLSNTVVVDAGSGSGAISRAVLLRFPSARVVGVEVNKPLVKKSLARLGGIFGAAGREPSFSAHSEDYVAWVDRQLVNGSRADYVIFNPPFEHAQAWATASLRLATLGVFMLQRLNWLGGGASTKATLKTRARMHWHRQNPAGLIVLPRRPSFAKSERVKLPDGKTKGGSSTDATEYAWFCWTSVVQPPSTFSIAKAEECWDEEVDGPRPHWHYSRRGAR